MKNEIYMDEKFSKLANDIVKVYNDYEKRDLAKKRESAKEYQEQLKKQELIVNLI